MVCKLQKVLLAKLRQGLVERLSGVFACGTADIPVDSNKMRLIALAIKSLRWDNLKVQQGELSRNPTTCCEKLNADVTIRAATANELLPQGTTCHFIAVQGAVLWLNA